MPPDLPPSVRDAVIAAQQDIAASEDDSEVMEDIDDSCSPPYGCGTTDINELAEGIIPPEAISNLPTINVATFIFYEQNGIPLSDGGTYDFSLDIDFELMTVGGPGSQVRVDDSPTAPNSIATTIIVPLAVQDFSDSVIPDFAVFDFSEKLVCGAIIIDCQFDVGTTIINGGSNADHFLKIENLDTGQTATGSGTSGVTLQP